jgi:hypothetical protein
MKVGRGEEKNGQQASGCIKHAIERNKKKREEKG